MCSLSWVFFGFVDCLVSLPFAGFCGSLAFLASVAWLPAPCVSSAAFRAVLRASSDCYATFCQRLTIMRMVLLILLMLLF